MPKSCAARQCCNRYSNRRKQLTFHRRGPGDTPGAVSAQRGMRRPTPAPPPQAPRPLLPPGHKGYFPNRVSQRGARAVRSPVLPPLRWAFPFSRPELLKEWVLNIGRGDFEPKQHTVICSEHFRPECFSAFGNRKNLKLNAVPTVFAFQGPGQLAREITEPAGEAASASPETGKVLLATGAGELGPGRKTDPAPGTLQLPPNAGEPGRQVLLHGPEAAKAPGQLAGPPGPETPRPTQPPDHSYALLDLDALKKKLFVTLKENEKLRKRLRAQRLMVQRLCSRLRACGAGWPGLQAGLRPGQRS
ncbi:THAP domain-containing protein 3 [Galemys pyrenaicus]|uniref:THAP domain-containing protein 3 n=1 Tax=Galemys pyrenaicus TaxID=202257 RepID=A0A8J5ZPZ2_GALPY|nr:THAP domain-containing protein 3 [Galemys pyrenaicus]